MRPITDIITDILYHGKLKNDAALARELSLKPNTISGWRSRNTMDYNLIISYCEQHNIPIAQILTGQITTEHTMVDGKRVLRTEHIAVKEDDSAMSGATRDVIKGDTYNELLINHDAKDLVLGENRSLTYGEGIKTNILRYPTELEPVVESFMAVMTSEDEDAKGSLARNVFTFHRTVTNERKIKKMEAEIFELRSEINNIKQQLLSMAKTDFKTAELTGEKQGGGAN